MTSDSRCSTRQTIGSGAPGFRLPAVDGEQRSLDDALAGRRGAVVVFWSSVCSHCARYDDALNAFEAAHPEVALVAIGCRDQESLGDLQAAAAARGLRFPILHDADRSVALAWEVQQTPKAFLVDARGVLLYRGAIDNFKYPEDPDWEPYLERAVADFLAGRPLARAETPSFGCPVSSVFYQLPKPFGT